MRRKLICMVVALALMAAAASALTLWPAPAARHYEPFEGVPAGAINGGNKVFTLTNAGRPLKGAPSQVIVWRNFPLIPGVGYTLGPNSGQITLKVAPQTGDQIFAEGWVSE